jgi:thioredoxin-like negative regulator of GroEL
MSLLGDRARARDLFRAGLAAAADSSQTLVELGNLALMDRNGLEALQSFDAVPRRSRLREHAAIGRASALSVLGRYGEAADAWLPIVAALPDSVPLRAACARNLTDAGRATEAARLLREGLARRKDPRLELSLAHALQAGAGSAREAVQAMARAAQTSPSKELLTALAIAQIRVGEREAALATRARVTDPLFLAKIDAALANKAAKP